MPRIFSTLIDINILLAWGGTYKTYQSHDVIFNEGTQCFYYHQLVKGRVIWANSNEEGKEFIQKIIEPGECFGELPLFDNELYAADAIALQPSVVIRITKSIFLQILNENPEIHFTFSKLLAQQVRYSFLIMKTIAFENPEIRIWTLLKYYKNKYSNKIGPFLINLTRQQIANMTGLRVETVIRVIRNLNRRGELIIEHGKVYL